MKRNPSQLALTGGSFHAGCRAEFLALVVDKIPQGRILLLAEGEGRSAVVQQVQRRNSRCNICTI